MKRMLICLLVLLPLCATATKKVHKPKTVELDRVAAVVNDNVITESELNKHMEKVYAQMMRTHQKLPTEKVLRSNVLNQLINKQLQLQIAKRNNTTVSEEEVDAAIDRIMKQNQIDKKQLEKEIEHQGMTFKEFEDQMRETVLIQKIQGMAVRSKVTVTDKEVDEFMTKQSSQFLGHQEFHLSHILIPIPDEPTTKQLQTAKMKAQQIYRKVLNGADFEKIASENATGESLQGSDLGWRKFAELPSIFSDQVKHMKANDVAGPLKAANGYHIIKLLGIKTAGKQLTKKDIRNMIFNQKMFEKINEWLQQVRGGAYIKIIS